jgi:hypothetical protein
MLLQVHLELRSRHPTLASARVASRLCNTLILHVTGILRSPLAKVLTIENTNSGSSRRNEP